MVNLTHERLTMRSQIIKKNVRMFVGSTVTIQLSRVYRALGSWVIVCYFGKPTVRIIMWDFAAGIET